MAGKGDDLPVSSLPPDGTFPTGTSKYEKRGIALEVPVWDENLCTQCNKCLIVCPHAAIRAKVFDREHLNNGASNLKYATPVGKEFDREKELYTLQVSAEDCTGCNLCVEVCPAVSKENPAYKALNMDTIENVRRNENGNWENFLALPEIDRLRLNRNTVKGTQFLQPLFEFSGACSGCGETPYVKLISQLFGDRMIIANATGCSSIYGGNLPTTPWTVNNEGRGPAWANSLFEDNAEFGLGIYIAGRFKRDAAFRQLKKVEDIAGRELIESIRNTDQSSEAGVSQQRENIARLKSLLYGSDSMESKQMLILADHLVKRSVWILGGDGWAYDIGFGGLDHVIASGENVNIMVLDTEVYSNTGGQTSKSTPRGATAKFSISGRNASKKDLPFMAISYGNVYVAQIALGANDIHTVRVMNEAEAFDGPSLIIAYSPCIAHGYEMGQSISHQKKAVESGYWPLFRYNPMQPEGKRFSIDSKAPAIPLSDYIYTESRYSSLKKSNPEHAGLLLAQAEEDVRQKWKRLEMLKSL
jgi:pyruvate-ferredoxin/flavodoxin oxidoreductase